MWVTDGLGIQRVWGSIFEPFGAIHKEDAPEIEGTIESFESDLDILTNHTSTETQQALDITLPLRFAGQYFDTETQLHYNYFRDYDPTLGRYIQSDLIGLAGGVNTYGYVYQNPVELIDPFGLAPPPICHDPTECVNPPFEPTADGPRPGPQVRPDIPSRAPPGSARYDMCEDYDLPEGICESCVDYACSYAPAYCCQVEKDACFANAIEDSLVIVECNAKYAACMFRAGK